MVDSHKHRTKSLVSVSRRDLLVSIGVLGLIICLALSRLALQGNWEKVLRVSLAFVAYSGVLLSLAVYTFKSVADRVRAPLWIFSVAGAAAELASGWLRPDWRLSDTLVLPLLAAVLVGGLHWIALISWRPLRQRVLVRPSQSSNFG